MDDIPKNLCNDINRLAAINVISLLVDRMVGVHDISLRTWKDNFLRDIGILMVYHQILSWIPMTYSSTENQGMINDFTKTTTMLVIPSLLKGKQPNLQHIGITLSGVFIYHKVVRKPLIKIMDEYGVKFNEGIEDMIETLLLLGMTRDKLDPMETVSELVSLAVYHATMKHT